MPLGARSITVPELYFVTSRQADDKHYVSLLYLVTSRQADDKHYVSLLYLVTSRQADDKHYVSLLYHNFHLAAPIFIKSLCSLYPDNTPLMRNMVWW